MDSNALENSQIKAIVANNTLWLFISEIASRLFKAIIIIYAIRALGKNGWGMFSYTLALMGFFTIFAENGLGIMVSREIASGGNNKKIISSAFFIKLVLLLISTTAFIIYGLNSGKTEIHQLIPIIGAMFFFDSLKEFYLIIGRAREKMHTESAIRISSMFLNLLLTIVLFTKSKTPISLGYAYMISAFFGLIFSYIAYSKLVSINKIYLSIKSIGSIFIEAWPFTILAITDILMFNIDTLMLGHFKSFGETGLYSAAGRMVQLFYILPALFSSALLPSLTKKLHSNDTQDLTASTGKAFSVISLFILPIIIAILFLSKDIVGLLFGSDYHGSIVPIYILIFSIFPVFYTTLLNSSLFALNAQRKFVHLHIIGLLISIILNLILIPMYGAIGASISLVLSLGFIAVSTITKFNNEHKIDFSLIRLSLPKLFISALIMSIIIYLLQISGVTGILIYFGILYILKENSLLEIINHTPLKYIFKVN